MEQNSKTKINRVKKDISNPKSFTAPDELRQQLMETMKSLYSDEDIEMVSRAYDMAFEAHKDQKRKSGEPYIIHPICVAIILAELELDRETIIAGLLHDVVEDTDVTYEDVVREFGVEVAQLVDGVTGESVFWQSPSLSIPLQDTHSNISQETSLPYYSHL